MTASDLLHQSEARPRLLANPDTGLWLSHHPLLIMAITKWRCMFVSLNAKAIQFENQETQKYNKTINNSTKSSLSAFSVYGVVSQKQAPTGVQTQWMIEANRYICLVVSGFVAFPFSSQSSSSVSTRSSHSLTISICSS